MRHTSSKKPRCACVLALLLATLHPRRMRWQRFGHCRAGYDAITCGQNSKLITVCVVWCKGVWSEHTGSRWQIIVYTVAAAQGCIAWRLWSEFALMPSAHSNSASIRLSELRAISAAGQLPQLSSADTRAERPLMVASHAQIKSIRITNTVSKTSIGPSKPRQYGKSIYK